jgi:hypothetical protein
MAQQTAYQHPIFQPARRTITAITNANPALVTCSFDTEFRDGDIIRITLPQISTDPVGFGMYEINGQLFQLTVNDDTSFYIDVDTTFFNPFVDASTTSGQYAQAVPVGEQNDTIYGATRNTLPSLVRPYSPS